MRPGSSVFDVPSLWRNQARRLIPRLPKSSSAPAPIRLKFVPKNHSAQIAQSEISG
jgi:hypothetical protein